jgi:hypothetical protein
MDDPRRETLKATLRSRLEQTIDDRVDRFLAVHHQQIAADHHFAHALSECIELYRDGHFLSCVLATQAVNEAIVNFIAGRNAVTRLAGEENPELMLRLHAQGIVSGDTADAAGRIHRSFRNDVHHLNPKVAGLNFEQLAMRNVLALAVIEAEIFAFDFGPTGTLVPKQPRYWDIQEGQSVPVYVRGV